LRSLKRILCLLQVMPKGPADGTDMRQGDIVERVDHLTCVAGTTVAQVSDAVRGKEGSFVVFFLRKPNGERLVVKLKRQRVPGGKTEMLGALWQENPAGKKGTAITREDKIEKLHQLRNRGSLSEEEFEQAMQTVNGRRAVTRIEENSFEVGLNTFMRAVNEDVSKLGEAYGNMFSYDPDSQVRKMGGLGESSSRDLPGPPPKDVRRAKASSEVPTNAMVF
jgi:hypothetical protein